VAAVLTFGILLVLWVISGAAALAGRGTLSAVIGYLSLPGHFSDFVFGVIDTQSIIYYVSIIGVFLFLTIRSRFGARMIPAKRLLMRVLRDRRQAGIVAMVADQDPVSASVRHFTDFFGQDTAFYMGPEAIARVAKMAVYYLAVRRVSRGHYSVTFEPLVAAGEELPQGAIIERYALHVEALTRERPADWLWSYRRWKVRRHRERGDEAAQIEITSGSD